MKKLIISSFLLTFILSGCQSQNVSWGYGEKNGPDKWSELSEEYATCGSGQMQSPINIDTTDIETGSNKLSLNYSDTKFEVVDTGHSIEFLDESEQNSIDYDGETYNLEQIHFHNESENTIDGAHYPLEGHFVHASESGENLVISVMFEVGEENIALADGFSKVSDEIDFNPKDLLPTELHYYNFMGSLTTPPCSENVKWIVFSNPMSISQGQLDAFNNYYTNNNRDTQDLNDREIIKN